MGELVDRCGCNFLDDTPHARSASGCAWAENTAEDQVLDERLRDDLRRRRIHVLDMNMTDIRICFFTRSVSARGIPDVAVTACVDWRPGWHDAMFARITEKYAAGQTLNAAELNENIRAMQRSS
jgi:hypothetical protein